MRKRFSTMLSSMSASVINDFLLMKTIRASNFEFYCNVALNNLEMSTETTFVFGSRFLDDGLADFDSVYSFGKDDSVGPTVVFVLRKWLISIFSKTTEGKAATERR